MDEGRAHGHHRQSRSTSREYAGRSRSLLCCRPLVAASRRSMAASGRQDGVATAGGTGAQGGSLMRRSRLTLVATLVLALLSGCTQMSAGGGSGDIYFGVSGPLTGPNAEYGQIWKKA